MSDLPHAIVSQRHPRNDAPPHIVHSDDSEGDSFPISPAQVIAILKTYWKHSALTFFIVLSSSLGLMTVVPKTYTAISTLLVGFDSPDPLAAKEMADFGPGSYLPTQIELIQSDAVMDVVIERLGLTTVPEFTSGFRGQGEAMHDWVALKLRKSLSIEPGRAGSQLIYISASATTSEMSANIANAVADAFLAQHFSAQIDPSGERVRRYEEELASLKRKVDEAQAALTEFRKHSGAVDFDLKSNVDVELLSSLEHRLLDARNALRSNEARATTHKDMNTSMLTSPTLVPLREEGAKLAAKMAQLRTEYGPNHPDVVALQSQIDANRAAQNAAQSALSSAASSDSKAAAQEVSSLENAVAAQRARVLRLKQYDDQASKYQLELESAQMVYRKALDGYDQQQFAATGQSSRIRIASRARPPVKASDPSLKKFLIRGFGGGLFIAVVLPFALELPRRKIRCRDDLERGLKVPVLIQMPYIPDAQMGKV